MSGGPNDEPMGRKPLVYVAGPITGDPFGCVRQAMGAFRMIRHAGCVPFLPQLSIVGEMVDPQDYEAWMAYDLDVIEHCDAVYRLRGESPGADREVAFARRLGIPVLGLNGQDWPALRSLADPPAPSPLEQT